MGRTRRRLCLNNLVALVSWRVNLALILTGAPLWSALLVGVLGSYFLLRDWPVICAVARERNSPPHRDLDVQAIIDGDIDISEYRQRKESQSS